MKKRLPLIVLAVIISLPALAQISLDGNERGSLKWSSVETQSYRLVYPSGMDSLARVFAFSLEKFRIPVAGTCGFVPNEAYIKKMPVVIHPFTSYSNGMVAWAPRRMAMMAVPDAYNPEALDWVDMLASHESRHVAQMQLSKSTPLFRAVHGLLGEMWAGATVGMYMGPMMLEGDAVAAETGLLPGGRGRTSDFLEYMRVSLLQGKYRDYWQWSYGSQKRFTPDHYRAGYMLVAGMRNSFDRPDFITYYNHRIARKTLPLFNLQKSVEELSGRNFYKSFQQIQEDFAASWEENAAARGPFTEGRQLTPEPRLYEEYYGLCVADTALLALRRGLARNTEMVELCQDGTARHLQYFSGISSRLSYSPLNHRVYWTEHRADHRWDAVSYSVLCCRDSLGNTRTIAAGRRYYNPAPHPSSGIVAVAEYPFEGGTRISVLSEEGSLLESFPAPAGLQATEPVWMDGRLYASAISEEGSGIYSLPGWKEIMAPVQAKVNHLSSRSGRIWFTCDIDGVNELYSLDVQNGTLWRETSVRFGGTDFVFAGDSLYFTSPGTDSRGIWVLSEDSLLGEEAPEEDAYPIATKLAMQETVRPDDEIEVDISDPEPYSKMGHLIQVHSWAPAFLDLDFVSAYSYEKTTVDAAPGAMVFFQNELSTSFGSAGVSLTDADLRFRPAAHLQYAYRGFLPVLEFRADLNDRETLHHRFDYDEENKAFVRSNVPDGKSLMSMSLVSYVPVNLSSGGWSRGVVPMVKAAWSNDRFGFLAYEGGGVQNLNVDGGIFINTEVRAYSMLPVTSSKIFPHLGLGGKVGASFSPFIYRYFGHTGYIGIYGYLPGLVSTHGLHLNLDASRSFGSDFFTLSSLGFQADYALPFGALDWSGLSPWMYLRNFELTGHADLSFSNAAYKLSDRNEPLRRHSVGASLAMHLGNFLWMPFDTLLGLKYMYCLTDPSLSALTMVFSMDIK